MNGFCMRESGLDSPLKRCAERCAGRSTQIQEYDRASHYGVKVILSSEKYFPKRSRKKPAIGPPLTSNNSKEKATIE